MGQLMTCGIYAIRNLTTNKVYVGKSINIEIRFAGHKSMLRSEVTHYCNTTDHRVKFYIRSNTHERSTL